MLKSNLKEYNLKGKTVLVRTDWNVPIKLTEGSTHQILDDTKLTVSLPTLKYIQEQGAKIVVITHWGEPKNNETIYSTEHFLPWLFNKGFSPRFAYTPEEALSIKKHDTIHDIIIIENIRFFSQEKTQDAVFAKSLATLGDYFVQDAFGTLHRADTSMTTLPALFEITKRTIGFLVEQELHVLAKFTATIKHPLTFILGGNKLKTKLPLIKNLLGKADNIIILPALVFTFLKALDKKIGNSLVEESLVTMAKEIINLAQKSTTKLIMPLDYRVTKGTFNDPIATHIIKDFESKNMDKLTGISVGPATIDALTTIISRSEMIFFNGPFGNINYADTTQELQELYKLLIASPAIKLFAGSDSRASFIKLGLNNFVLNHPECFSTGGGATLEYLAGKKLIGLTYFN